MAKDRFEDSIVTVEHCSTPSRVFCTICFHILAANIVVASVMFSYSVSLVISPIKSLPSTLETIFDEALGFGVLQSSLDKVIDASETGLAKCGAVPSNCPEDLPAFGTMRVDMSKEVEDIQDGITGAVSQVHNISNDIYFGIKQIKDAEPDLKKAKEDADSAALVASTDLALCAVMAPKLCEITEKAEDAQTTASDIVDSVKKSTGEYSPYLQYLNLLYLIPAFAMLSLVFYLCFLCIGGVCCCSTGGSGAGCATLACYSLWALLSFVLVNGLVSAIIFVSYSAVDFLDTKPNFYDLAMHINELVPDDSKIKRFVWGSELTFESLVALSWTGNGLLIYSVVVCCWQLFIVKHEFFQAEPEDKEALVNPNPYKGSYQTLSPVTGIPLQMSNEVAYTTAPETYYAAAPPVISSTVYTQPAATVPTNYVAAPPVVSTTVYSQPARTMPETYAAAPPVLTTSVYSQPAAQAQSPLLFQQQALPVSSMQSTSYSQSQPVSFLPTTSYSLVKPG